MALTDTKKGWLNEAKRGMAYFIVKLLRDFCDISEIEDTCIKTHFYFILYLEI